MRNIIFTIGLLFIITIEIFSQYSFGPSQTDYRRKLHTDMNGYVYGDDLAQLNTEFIIGREAVNIIHRGVYQWNITENEIPDNSSIDLVSLVFDYSDGSSSYDFFAKFYNISYDMISENYFTQIFFEMAYNITPIGYQTGNEHHIVFESADPNGAFNQAIRNSLSNDKFVLGIKWGNDSTPYNYNWFINNSTITLYIEYTPPTNLVTIDQRNSFNSQIGVLKKWEEENNNWGNEFNPGSQFNFGVSSHQTILADQRILSNQKYNKWQRNSVNEDNNINHHSFQISINDNNFTSRLEPTYPNVIIKNSLEGTTVTGGYINFADPWYIDYTDPSFRNSIRNRGMNDTGSDALQYRSRTSPFNPDYTTIFQNGDDPSQAYKGLFLNQDPTFDPDVPNYLVQSIDDDIVMGGKYGTRPFYFLKWEGEDVNFENHNSMTTGVVFTASDATVNAVLKGHLLSAAQLGTNGQRHLVRDSDGLYHLFYISMNKLWYTRSSTTSITGAWDDELCLFSEDAKSVSIDIDGDLINIVFEGKDGSNYKIYRSSLNADNGATENPVALADISSSYYGSAYPVVAASSNERFFVYRKSSTGGLYYIRQYNEVIWHTESETSVPNTGFTSLNPAVCMDRQGTSYDVLHLVYQDGNLGTSIKYTYWGSGSFRGLTTISGSSGYSINTCPSVSPVKKDKGGGLFRYDPIVSWLGTSGGTLGKTDGESVPTPRLIARVCNDWTQNTWGSTNVYGEEVNTTQNASASNAFNQSVIAWGQKDGTESLWIRRYGTIYFGPYCLEPEGNSINISNGTSLLNMKALSFDNVDLPYILNPSGTGFTGTPCAGGENKVVTTYPFTFSRAGVILKKGVEFAYHTGDVVVDDSALQFIEVPDTLTFGNSIELNQILKTKDFPLNSNSSLLFSNYYYVLNKEFADSLTAEESVSYRVELVNSASGNVAGTFDNIIYNKQNLDDYENVSYHIDCSGIAEGNYFFRLVTAVTGDAEYYLINAVNDAGIVAKRSFDKISFTGDKLPVTYHLSQNYPNPFNPATTINYQLPKTGHVTLKIYDILGKEVTTLVSEQKTQGRYSVNFIASSGSRRMASGVYIYQIRVNDYVSSKKMLLLK